HPGQEVVELLDLGVPLVVGVGGVPGLDQPGDLLPAHARLGCREVARRQRTDLLLQPAGHEVRAAHAGATHQPRVPGGLGSGVRVRDAAARDAAARDAAGASGAAAGAPPWHQVIAVERDPGPGLPLEMVPDGQHVAVYVVAGATDLSRERRPDVLLVLLADDRL